MTYRIQATRRGNIMKLVLTLLGVVLLVVAAVYFLVPADQLPGYFPGHDASLTRMRTTHGIASGVVGLTLIGAGMFLGRRYHEQGPGQRGQSTRQPGADVAPGDESGAYADPE